MQHLSCKMSFIKKIAGSGLAYLACFTLLAASLPANAAGVKCSDFRTQAEAQAYFNAKKPGYKRLDRDKDGIACESLRKK